ncbi:MAG TPA: hypothetical protein VGO50_16155 [Pyrinomonadaceae bacterium]|jgi:hypothetical protein|nr:hypothetical protein [Pyrinomonadaceae bacterium]
MTELAEWDSFYLIVGSAAGALIGLQFVVMTLIASRPNKQPGAEVGAAFATPTVIHFGAALLLSAGIRAPWPDVACAAIFWGLVGAIGTIYSILVTLRMRRQTVYQPVFEDWLFHAILPIAAYATLAISALAAIYYAKTALFGVGASALLLLFIGIHNAWDTATYNIFVIGPKLDAKAKKEEAGSAEEPDDEN